VASPDDLLKNWFDLLTAMQSTAKILNLDTQDDLGKFAGQKVKDLLQGSVQRQTFEQQMAGKLHIADSDLDGATTFRDLMNAVYNPLDVYVLGVFKDVAGSSYDGTSPADFGKKLTAQVYATVDSQQKLIVRLQSDMKDPWFPDKQENKAEKLRAQFGDPTKKVGDSVALVAALGLPK
jgi:hypothetical protein